MKILHCISLPAAAAFKPINQAFQLILIFSLLLTAGTNSTVNGAASGPYLVKDLNPATLPSTPKDFLPAGQVVYFTADDGKHGRELWVTDGTDPGTQMVADILPGAEASDPEQLTLVNGQIFFTAYSHSPRDRRDLWVSDGTQGGTHLVVEILPEGGYQDNWFSDLVNYQSKLYFLLNGHLWSSDGSATGTAKVSDVQIWGADLVLFKGQLFFTGSDDLAGIELWTSDGTGSGTKILKDLLLGTEGSEPHAFLIADNTLYFIAYYEKYSGWFWSTDGTEVGTKMLPGSQSGGPGVWERFAISGDFFYFPHSTSSNQNQLWVYDKKNGSAQLLKDIEPSSLLGDPSGTITFQNTFYFVAYDDTHGTECWTSDGTPEGTQLMKDLAPGYAAGCFGNFTILNGFMYFVGESQAYNLELWRSDGTANGITLVKDINPGPSGSTPSFLTKWNDKIIFSAWGDAIQKEAWLTDGSAQGTIPVADINKFGDSTVTEGDVSYNGKYFFVALANLWMSDGSTVGTRPVLGYSSGKTVYPRFQRGVAIAGNILYFIDDAHGLWRTDGTPDGTWLVRNVADDPYASVEHMDLVSAKNQVFFLAMAKNRGWALFRSDGSYTGTVPIFYGGYSDTYRDYMHVGSLGNEIIFAVERTDGPNVDLYITDGVQTPVKFYELIGGSANENKHIDDFVPFAGRLYFRGDSPPYDYASLYVTDGTTAGTKRVRVSGSTQYIARPQYITALDDALYFNAFDRVSVRSGLWKLMPGSDEAVLIKTFPNNWENGGPGMFHKLNNLIFFREMNSPEGDTYWVSDGTTEGTRELCPSCGFTLPSIDKAVDPALFGDRVYFSAADAAHGMELWVSDGTEAGTSLFADINPGMASSDPLSLHSIGAWLYFSANDGVNGSELWAYKMDLPFSTYLPNTAR